MKKIILILGIISLIPFLTFAIEDDADKKLVYVIELKQTIDKSSMRLMNLGIDEAHDMKADYILVDINTYGGLVDAADSIRTAILQSSLPVISFINIQAVSAGALISLACDSIYMRTGATFGAATVVDGQGKVMPDKYQAFMRAMMRATAEAQGKKIIYENGQEKEVWRRDPSIAQQMTDTANVLSFTVEEAISKGFSEGKAESIEEVVANLNIGEYKIHKQELSFEDKVILFLLLPVLQSIFLMMIIGGLYFELQSPGIGFPIVISILGAMLYFAPLYISGLAMNWEIVLFVAGLILIAIELFVLPGFGIAGILGIAAILTSLVFAMIDNDLFYFDGEYNFIVLLKPLSLILLSVFLSLVGSIWAASKLFQKKSFSPVVLHTKMDKSNGWVGVENELLNEYVGEFAIAMTDMRPSGKIKINGKWLEAIIEYGVASRGDELQVVRAEGGKLYCKMANN